MSRCKGRGGTLGRGWSSVSLVRVRTARWRGKGPREDVEQRRSGSFWVVVTVPGPLVRSRGSRR